ncbi:MAG TPA: hypothetical protein VJ866_23610 [Pyrinomonadaceae bacterium]|nr:hypothetical protein [Pyrinomonadaceae bacterium]
MRYTKSLTASFAAVLCLTLAAAARAQSPAAQPTPALSAKDKQTVAAFEKRVKDYVALREGIEARMPKLSKEATPEQIEAHKKSFQEAVRAARTGAKPGQFFTADAAAFIRSVVRDELKGQERQQMRKEVTQAETDAVALRVNYPYPDTDELLDMPPTLLLRLPQLPKQVRYRFVGHNMLLVDRENGLILDYMTGALP